jgi:hypothetical protein
MITTQCDTLSAISIEADFFRLKHFTSIRMNSISEFYWLAGHRDRLHTGRAPPPAVLYTAKYGSSGQFGTILCA